MEMEHYIIMDRRKTSFDDLTESLSCSVVGFVINVEPLCPIIRNCVPYVPVLTYGWGVHWRLK